PRELSLMHRGERSTQQAFGGVLSTLSRECPELAERLVTVSPDVASSTNLGGWINKHDVWRLCDPESLPDNPAAGILHWTESTRGQHIELGISENNLFLMLGQLGLSRELFGELLLPIGTLYDPFIRRGLDALFYSIYSGAKFIFVGTPSGVTLASEGGIHQSLLTPSIGTELPEVLFYEPCFAQELEWILLDALARLQRRESSTYLRLTTRRVDQELFPWSDDAQRRERLRGQVLAGAYRLRDCRGWPEYQPGRNVVHLFASGVMLVEALAAHEQLRGEGLCVNVINVTGPGPLYARYQRAVRESISGAAHASQSQTAPDGAPSVFEELVPADERQAPLVTLVDGHPHSLAWLGGALGSRVWPLGVDRFGQSGSLPDIYGHYGLDAASVAAACRAALNRERG
ncbi:MAG: hypothetical protein J5I93_25220, partial [Pirellulaceae bacterium]|nr:hypothetical protein [Pirellulaceae bacterium]